MEVKLHIYIKLQIIWSWVICFKFWGRKPRFLLGRWMGVLLGRWMGVLLGRWMGVLLIWYIVLTVTGLTPSGSSTVHIYTHTHTQYREEHNWHKQYIEQHKKFGRVRTCSIFAGFTLAFALQLRKKHGKTSVRVAEKCQMARWKGNIQNRTYITIRIHNLQN
jgi:hypothetical protein